LFCQSLKLLPQHKSRPTGCNHDAASQQELAGGEAGLRRRGSEVRAYKERESGKAPRTRPSKQALALRLLANLKTAKTLPGPGAEWPVHPQRRIHPTGHCGHAKKPLRLISTASYT
jgi:hypothetical protein